MARRGRRGRRSTQRSRNRARNRARAQRAAKKRVSARKAAGRKPSGANKAANRAAAKARAQAAAKKRIAQGRTISQTKAANTASMRKAAAERNRVFQQKKAAEAAARKARAEAKKQTPSPTQTFNKNLNTIQNKNLVATTPYNKLSPGLQNILQNQYDAFDKQGKGAGELKRLQNMYPGFAPRVDLAAAGDLSGLGIGQATPSGYKPGVLGNYLSKELGLDPKTGRELPKGNPNVMSADGTFNRPGPGGPEKEADYTSYQPGSFYKQSDTNLNMTNALRSTRNLITAPARALGINNQFTNRLIPKSNEAIQDSRDQRGPRPTLTRRRSGGGGGSTRIAEQAAATELLPEIAPTIGQPISQTGAAPTVTGGGAQDLTRIQSQAYNTQLTSSLAGMFGGQGSVGYTPQGSPELSPTLRAGQSRGRRRVRLFGARRRRGGTGDQFSRAGDRIAKLTNINV